MRFWYFTDAQRHLVRCSGAGISYADIEFDRMLEASDDPLALAIGSLELFTAELSVLAAALRLLCCSSRKSWR